MPFAQLPSTRTNWPGRLWDAGRPADEDITVILLLRFRLRGKSLPPARTPARAFAPIDGPIACTPLSAISGLDRSKMIRYIPRCKENIALGAIMSKFEYLKLADTV